MKVWEDLCMAFLWGYILIKVLGFVIRGEQGEVQILNCMGSNLVS